MSSSTPCAPAPSVSAPTVSAPGYRRILNVALPLVASMASTTVMQFTDRIFLSHYSLESLAASLSAGISAFVLGSFFAGVTGYVNVFVAQYEGAARPERIGAAVWQGVWFALLAGAVMALLSLLGPSLFALAGHSAEVQVLERQYFAILCLGAGPGILSMALSCFFSGRGLTRPVMVVNMTGALVNIPLDYALINGAWGMPEMGIRGAAWATVAGWCLTATLFALLVMRRRNQERYGILSGWRPDRGLFKRLMRFGLPGGAQFFLDVFGFTVFVLIVGRLGDTALAATNMVFSLNHLAFMPMVGVHIATETLVGQAMGSGHPGHAVAVTRRALHLNLAWGAALALWFVAWPGPLLELFRPSSLSPEAYAPMREVGRILLVYVAGYTLFDAVVITYQGALKGAGDTAFVMRLSLVLSVCVMAVPVWLVVEVFQWGLYAAWSILFAFITTLALGAWWRFRSGRWRGHQVIEH